MTNQTVEEILARSGIKDDSLQHFGVKGMRWGIRKAEDSADGSSAKPKKSTKPTNADIKSARERQKTRAREFEEASAEYYTSRTAKGEAAAERLMRNKEWELYNGPDRDIADRMTTGEKVVTGIFAGAPIAIYLATRNL